ncbi:MAG: dethiobiotin synthase, partial [Bacteroidota bacterium]
TMKIKSLISNTNSVFYPESFLLSKPISPHAAAFHDKVQINPDDIIPPKHTGTLIIEGAGGLMVPLNKKFLVIDLIEKLKAEVVLVSKNYLGSINHTLLSAEALQNRNIPVIGIIFNGKTVNTTEKFIRYYTGLKCLLRINQERKIDKKVVQWYSKNIFLHLMSN